MSREVKENIISWILFAIIIILIVIITILVLGLKKENRDYKNRIDELEKEISSLKYEENTNN